LPEFLALERYALQHHLADVITRAGCDRETSWMPPAAASSRSPTRSTPAAAGRRHHGGRGQRRRGPAGIDRSLKHFYPAPRWVTRPPDPLVCGGGTRFSVTRTGTMTGETAWAGSGGGVSTCSASPPIKRSCPPGAAPAGGTRAPGRGLRRIAWEPCWLACAAVGGCSAGTSAAAPQWAGLVALADRRRRARPGLRNASSTGWRVRPATAPTCAISAAVPARPIQGRAPGRPWAFAPRRAGMPSPGSAPARRRADPDLVRRPRRRHPHGAC